MTPTPDTQWNDADDDLLSAYVDNDLADVERVAFEARLQREPALQAALDDLRATVTLLHDLPQLALPRSFTLDPAMHRPRWQRWSAWLWRFSALAAMLLALTFTLDFAGSSSMPSAVFAPQSAAALTSAPAATASMNAEVAAPAAPAATSAPAAAAAAAAMAPAATPNAAADSAANTALGAAGVPSTTEVTSAQVPSAAKQQSATDATGAAAADTASTAIESSALTSSRVITSSGSSSPDTAAFEQPAAQPPQTTVQPIQPVRRIAPLRIVQIALAVLVVLLAGAALWVARRRA